MGVGTKGALTIAAGAGIGQAAATLASPLLSRLYTPAEFGVFSIVSALAMTLGVIAAGRLDLAIPIATDEEAQYLATLAITSTILSAAIATLALLISWPIVADLPLLEGLAPWILVVPALAGLIGTFRCLNQWALRQRHYTAAAQRNVIQGTVTVLAQIVTGGLGARASGLVGGLALGQLAGCVALLKGSGLKFERLTWRVSKSIFVSYSRFPLVLAPAGLLNALSIYAPIFLVGALYGVKAVGWLGLTQRVLAVPILLIGQAVAQVYLGELARQHRASAKRQRDLFIRASRRLALISLPISLVLLLISPPVFEIVLGAAWRTSGDMARALALGIGAQLIAAPISQTLIVRARHRTQLFLDLARLVLLSSAILISAQVGADLIACIWAYSLTLVVSYTVTWELSRRAI